MNNAASNAVASMSLGGGASVATDTAVANMVAAGIPTAVAAGNENQNACNVSPARESSVSFKYLFGIISCNAGRIKL